MNFYTKQHQFYAGIDLHARLLAVCILDSAGQIVCQTKIPADKQVLLDTLAPFRDDVVGCASACSPGTGSPTCERKSIPFVLGHALAMKAIHGGKAKNDRLDAEKIAGLLKGGFFPMAYVYPKAKRDTRDLLRRRSFFVRQRAQLIAHIQNTNSQLNLPPFDKKLTYAQGTAPKCKSRNTSPARPLEHYFRPESAYRCLRHGDRRPGTAPDPDGQGG